MPPDLHRLRTRLIAQMAASDLLLKQSSADQAGQAHASQQADGNWGDLDYAESNSISFWPPARHLERTRALALYWNRSGERKFLAAALAGVAFWVRRDPLSSNWWFNQINTPRVLGEAILLVREHLAPGLLLASRPLLARASPDVIMIGEKVFPIKWTGANRLWISANRLFAGAIFGESELIGQAMAAAMEEVRVSSREEEGLQADGSFHQHGPLLYNGGYGRSYLDECIFFLNATQGTQWEPGPVYGRLLADFLLDGTRWMLRGEEMDPGCRDREITRGHIANSSFAVSAAFLAGIVASRRVELADLAEAVRRRAAPGGLVGNRMFYRSDFMVQQNPASYISVRMHSRRTLRAECCNGEGLRSHHVSDGLTYLMRTGGEYRDIFPVWDWQKLPGTTCLQTSQPEPWQTVGRTGATAYVGGVSDGHYGACCQYLCNDHLLARKSWFFGPEGVVCLGAGIQSAFSGRVLTTLDQSLNQGAVEWSGAMESCAPGRHVLAGARWLKHGPWGFVFPKPAEVLMNIGPATGAWSSIGAGSSTPVTKDIFLASLDHGETPVDAGYIYSILPAAERSRLELEARRPGFEVLVNTPSLQAVWRARDQLLQAVFYEEGAVNWPDGWSLRVNKECIVMLSRDAGEAWHLDLADFRQEGRVIEVALSCAGRTVWSGAVPCPTGDNLGKTVRVF